jgi:ankyrin repeat protein
MTQWRFNRALLNGDDGLAIYLLSIGASPNKDSHFFESPVEQAILRGKKVLFDALVVHGADVNAKTSDGLSLAEFAKENKASWALDILKGS